MRPVARTIIAAKRAGVSDGHAAQVGAHAEEDEKLWILDALVVGLGVAQF